jgi:probable O-glycosylation ligase (exosortase A-associated)
MPIRDVLITLIVIGSIPYIFKRPYIGVLMWSWLGYMNPHRLSWGFAYSMPFSQIIAIVLLAALLLSQEKKQLPKDATINVWIVFLVWMGITTIFAVFPHSASNLYVKIVKIQIVTFLTMMLINDQKKMDMLIWVIVASIGYYSVKGGIFTIQTGGAFRVWGPPGSFIEENNSLALATLMVIPLMLYLHFVSDNKWVKYGLIGAMCFSLASVLGSQSRGAFLAILAVGGYFWMISNKKAISGAILIFLAVVGFMFMPQSWHDRMATIQNYEEDASAMGRINAWTYSVNIASNRITGGGLNSWKLETFARYAPDPLKVHAAHSIYFGPLGDHGWPGLLLFVSILVMVWLSLDKVIKRSDDKNEVFLAKMIKVCLVAYCSGGAFLSLAYFDLPWHLFAFSILLKHQMNNRMGDKPSINRRNHFHGLKRVSTDPAS